MKITSFYAWRVEPETPIPFATEHLREDVTARKNMPSYVHIPSYLPNHAGIIHP